MNLTVEQATATAQRFAAVFDQPTVVVRHCKYGVMMLSQAMYHKLRPTGNWTLIRTIDPNGTVR